MQEINASHYIFFSYGLNIKFPWRIYDIKMKEDNDKNGDILIKITYDKDYCFKCENCNEVCKIEDSILKSWRHIDFFDKKCIINVDIPKLICERHGIFLANTPFGNYNSDFSFALEDNIVINSQFIPIKNISSQFDIPEKKIWSTIMKNINIENSKCRIVEVNNLMSDGTVNVNL